METQLDVEVASLAKSVLPPVDEHDASDKRLQELGYKSEFRRDMSLFGVLGISFCAIGILTGMSSAFQTGLFSGGPLGLFWGWNIVSFFMLLIALALAEICSAYPTMGGLYFWVCKMKPETPVLGFCTGWIYSIALVFTGTSGNLSVALYLASLAEVGQNRTLTRVEITAIAWGVNIASGIINTVGTKGIGAMSSLNVWWTLGGTFVLVITLLVKAPMKNTADFVFTDYQNFTGWSNRGFVVLLGFLQAVYSLEGCETAAQVAEEAQRAEILAPLAVVGSVVGSWLIGLAYMLALLFFCPEHRTRPGDDVRTPYHAALLRCSRPAADAHVCLRHCDRAVHGRRDGVHRKLAAVLRA